VQQENKLTTHTLLIHAVYSMWHVTVHSTTIRDQFILKITRILHAQC